MSAQLVAAFRGTVQCRHERGAVRWCLTGADREDGSALEVLLSGGAGGELPPELSGAELYRLETPADGQWVLRSHGTRYPLALRAVQVHRSAAGAFKAALPAIRTPWTTRAGWWLLLNLLRLPGVARLLRRRQARLGG